MPTRIRTSRIDWPGNYIELNIYFLGHQTSQRLTTCGSDRRSIGRCKVSNGSSRFFVHGQPSIKVVFINARHVHSASFDLSSCSTLCPNAFDLWNQEFPIQRDYLAVEERQIVAGLLVRVGKDDKMVGGMEQNKAGEYTVGVEGKGRRRGHAAGEDTKEKHHGVGGIAREYGQYAGRTC